MRYGRIFLLQCQNVLQERGRAFVWFLMAALNPLILILFWKGAAGNKMIAPGWDFASLSSYYFLSTIMFSLLIVHQESEVSNIDIREGMLVTYLLNPFSYYWRKLLEEVPYRLIQAFYGCVLCFAFFLFFSKKLFSITSDIQILLLSIIIICFGLFISFTWKMIMGITAFWFTDTRGFFEAMYVIEYTLGGILIPIALLPSFIAPIAYILPFSYIIYFPITALQGKFGVYDLLHVIGMQIIWLSILGFFYHLIWTFGIKKFSGVGQ